MCSTENSPIEKLIHHLDTWMLEYHFSYLSLDQNLGQIVMCGERRITKELTEVLFYGKAKLKVLT